MPLSPPLAASLDEIVDSYRACCDLFDVGLELSEHPLDRNGTMDTQLRTRILQLQLAVLHIVESSGPTGGGFDPEDLRGLLATIHAHGDGLEQRFFDQCARKQMLIPEARMLSQRIRRLETIATRSAEQVLPPISQTAATQPAPKTDPPSRVKPVSFAEDAAPLPAETEMQEGVPVGEGQVAPEVSHP